MNGQVVESQECVANSRARAGVNLPLRTTHTIRLNMEGLYRTQTSSVASIWDDGTTTGVSF